MQPTERFYEADAYRTAASSVITAARPLEGGGGLVALSANIAASGYVREGIEVGDHISLGETEGTVEDIQHAAVVLRSEDGHLYRVPNRMLLEGIVRKRTG